MKRRIVVIASLLVACSKTAAPEPAPSTTGPGATAPPAASTVGVAAAAPSAAAASPSTTSSSASAAPSDVAYTAPAAWKEVATGSKMRKATYTVPPDAELAISTAGGGVEPNVKRWAGQFAGAKPKTDKRKVNGLDVTVVEIKGDYTGMGAMSASKGQMLLGAIVDLGETQEFFKLIGPEKTVTAARPDFEKLVASLRAK